MWGEIVSIVSGFFNNTINYIYSVDTDGWGDVATTLSASNVLCRWQESVGRIVSETEDVKEYKVEAWIDSSEATILEDYQVSKGSKTYKVMKVIDSYDIIGNKDHIKLYLE